MKHKVRVYVSCGMCSVMEDLMCIERHERGSGVFKDKVQGNKFC